MHRVAEYISNNSKKTKEEIYLYFLKESVSVDEIERGYQELQKDKRTDDIRRKAVYWVSVIGALLIGIGFISWVSTYWSELEHTAKTFILVIGLLILYITGGVLHQKTEYKTTAISLIFAGNLVYGGALFLISEVFNTNNPAGIVFYLWYLGVIPFTVLLKKKIFFATQLIVGIAAFFYSGGTIFDFGYYPDPVSSEEVLLLLVMAGFTGYQAYNMKIKKWTLE